MIRIEIVPLKDAPVECVLYTLTDREIHVPTLKRPIKRTSFMRKTFLAARQTRQAVQGGYAVLARNSKEIVGWALVAPFSVGAKRDLSAVGIGIFVREPFRRKGHGLKLAKLVKDVAAEHYPTAKIIVGPHDEAGEKTFTRAGYDTRCTPAALATGR